MKIFSLIILLFIAVFANAEKKQIVFKTGVLPKNDTVLVFTPNKVEKANAPVVFLLHGFSGNYASWNRISDLQYFADKYECIIVCPDGLFDSWYVDSPVMQNSKFTTFFYAILLPAVKRMFRIDERNIFITGLSMGGFGALHLFLEYPYIFRAVASTSGMVWLTPMPGEFGLPKVFGKDKEVFEKFSIINRIGELKNSGKPVLIDCGTEDFFYNQHLNFFKRAEKINFNFKKITGPGTHNGQYWKKMLPEHFAFFNANMIKG